MRTVSYSDFKSRFQSLIGVDVLLSTEETALKNSLNDRIRGAWTRAKWPDVQTVVEKTVAAVTSPIIADKAVRIDNTNPGDSGELMDVYQVFNKNPLTDRTAVLLNYQLIGGYLVLPADSSESSVFVVGNLVPANNYGDGTTDLPAFLERYLLLACVSDYYKADGQLDKAIAQEQMAEETLALELDRVERLESMNKITFNTYPSYSFGVSLLTTT